MAWGITVDGFVRKKLSEIKTDIETGIKQYFGVNANVGTSSVFGKIIGVFSSGVASLWELAEDVYNSFSPDTASGIALDNCVALTGIQRKAATESTAWVYNRLVAATTIPIGNRVQVAATSPAVVFAHDLACTTPALTECYGIWMQVGVVAAGDTYRVIISGTNCDYTALPGDTALIILNALQAVIELSAVKDLVRATVMTGETTLQVLLEPDGNDVPVARVFNFAILGGGGGTWINTHIAQVGYLTCTATGPYEAPAGTLTTILDPVVGWTSVHQLVDADEGSDIETDEDLRLRRERSIHVANGGSIDAIRTALLEIEAVDEAIVLENITDVVDTLGVPPHAIYAILDAPADPEVEDEIAETIWASKPGGIATHGAIPITVVDSQGFEHVINFGLVVDIRIYMEVQYHIYDEESFPATGEDGIAEACAAYGETLAIGKDLMPHRFFGPIFEAVPGIEWLIVGASLNPGGPWLPAAIPIAADRRATVAAADVTVVLVP